jgi:hypothetical protein
LGHTFLLALLDQDGVVDHLVQIHLPQVIRRNPDGLANSEQEVPDGDLLGAVEEPGPGDVPRPTAQVVQATDVIGANV